MASEGMPKGGPGTPREWELARVLNAEMGGTDDEVEVMHVDAVRAVLAEYQRGDVVLSYATGTPPLQTRLADLQAIIGRASERLVGLANTVNAERARNDALVAALRRLVENRATRPWLRTSVLEAVLDKYAGGQTQTTPPPMDPVETMARGLCQEYRASLPPHVSTEAVWTEFVEEASAVLKRGCRADTDGECSWNGCPQKRDLEPETTGRHCPIDVTDPER